jgi:metal-responsive CopG/Arc/MetJ family transcriptional regulator
MGGHLKTVQMTIEPKLVAEVDRVARRLGVTRSAFARRAFRAEIDRIRVEELERRHREGYRRKPVRRGEFDAWTSEQVWPD